MVGEHNAVIRDEVEKVGHLLQVRGNVRVIASEMNIVELDINHMLDIATRRVKLATTRICGLSTRTGQSQLYGRGKWCQRREDGGQHGNNGNRCFLHNAVHTFLLLVLLSLGAPQLCS